MVSFAGVCGSTRAVGRSVTSTAKTERDRSNQRWRAGRDDMGISMRAASVDPIVDDAMARPEKRRRRMVSGMTSHGALASLAEEETHVLANGGDAAAARAESEGKFREKDTQRIGFKSKIICTLGPVSRTVEILEQMLRAGMSIARSNFSHGSTSTIKRRWITFARRARTRAFSAVSCSTPRVRRFARVCSRAAVR